MELADLIHLLDGPEGDEALRMAFGEPEHLDIDEGLLPRPDDQPCRRASGGEEGHWMN